MKKINIPTDSMTYHLIWDGSEDSDVLKIIIVI